MTNNLHFSVSKFVGDITGLGTGYTSADPHSPILGNVHEIVQSAIPMVSQPVVDEITKAFAGIVLAVVSRMVFAQVDKFVERRKERKRKKSATIEK